MGRPSSARRVSLVCRNRWVWLSPTGRPLLSVIFTILLNSRSIQA